MSRPGPSRKAAGKGGGGRWGAAWAPDTPPTGDQGKQGSLFSCHSPASIHHSASCLTPPPKSSESKIKHSPV